MIQDRTKKAFVFFLGFSMCFLIIRYFDVPANTEQNFGKPKVMAPKTSEDDDDSYLKTSMQIKKDKTATKPKCDVAKDPLCQFATPEDIRTTKLPPFLKNYKNPCWSVDTKDEGPPPIRCIPYFFLAGAPKSGTTDLYKRIILHPQVSDQLRKEIHWFSRHHFITTKTSKRLYPMPLFKNYTDMFIKADQELYETKDSKGYHNMIFGDSSVSTFWDNTYAIRYAEATGDEVPWTPESIHHLNPDTKFISIIRDPVERAYSDYLFFDVFRNKSKEAFHEGVIKALEDHKDCLEMHSLRYCIAMGKRHIRVWIGIYHGLFKEFFKIFPRNQFIIMTMEEYANNMAGKLEEIFAFLGLDPVSKEEMAMISDKSEIHNTRKIPTIKIGDMLPETRELLRKFYRPHNDQLGKLLGEKFNYNTKYTKQ